eukprot:6176807-Pleurochrysis_carterae.AAC.3
MSARTCAPLRNVSVCVCGGGRLEGEVASAQCARCVCVAARLPRDGGLEVALQHLALRAQRPDLLRRQAADAVHEGSSEQKSEKKRVEVDRQG